MDNRREIVFSPPDMTDEEVEEVKKALLSGWITTGPKTKELENMLADFCGTDLFVCFNSATAAMEMTYRLLGIGEGDEVITTAYTYTATSSAICHVGAKPVMVDILGDKVYEEKRYIGHSPYEPDYDEIDRAFSEKTKAIAPVDIAGVMCDYDRLAEIAKAHAGDFSPSDNRYQKAMGRAVIVADSAHGLGASKNGKMSGQKADFTTFSFHAVKNLTTGEGGAVTWRKIEGIDNEDIYHEYMLLSLHGQSKDALEKTEIGSWEYDIIFPGYKCNMTDIQAAIGIAQLRRYPGLLKRRREIVNLYDEGINRISRLTGVNITSLAHYTETSTSSGHLYLMRVGGYTHKDRCRLIRLMAEKGVPANVHYKPLPMLTAYKNMGYRIEDCPRAYQYYENEITLPLHTLLSNDDVAYILDVLTDALKDNEG